MIDAPHPAPSDLAPLIQALPKAELHLHLEGSLRPHRAEELARHAQRTLPGLLPDPNAANGWRFHIPDFRAFLRLYVAISACLTEEAHILELIDAVAESLEANRVRYAELTVTPMTLLRGGLSESALLSALHQGRLAAREARGIELRWVFDVVRSIPEDAFPTLDLALRARQQGVGLVALGIGGPEHESLTGKRLAPAFDKALANDLPAVPHAGEQTGAWAVWEALELFHPRRIGHGIRCIEDPALLERLQREQLCLEISPTSNLKLVHVPSYEEHPIQRILSAGIPVTLATDDPGLLDTSLEQEYLCCARAFQWTPEQVRAVARTGILCSLAEPELKETLLAQQDAAFAQWRDRTKLEAPARTG